MTMTLIETATVGSGGSNTITFTSIPQTYTDLYVVASLRTNESYHSAAVLIYPNGETTNGTRRALYGTGSSAGGESASNVRWDYFAANSATSNTFGSGGLYIANYAGATKKTFSSEGVSETNGSTVFSAISSGLWSSTAAITSLSFRVADVPSSFMQYSTISLYGILKGSGGATVS